VRAYTSAASQDEKVVALDVIDMLLAARVKDVWIPSHPLNRGRISNLFRCPPRRPDRDADGRAPVRAELRRRNAHYVVGRCERDRPRPTRVVERTPRSP
jgi:hypothetical protein